MLLASSYCFAQNGIVGKWQTIDDASGKPKAIIRIDQKDGAYFGTIESLLPGTQNRCEGCEGKKKDGPILNMVVLKDLKEDGENRYSGGSIFDPKSGKTYQCKAEIVDDGKKLDVRGFVGFSLLGRTQTWKRVE